MMRWEMPFILYATISSPLFIHFSASIRLYIGYIWPRYRRCRRCEACRHGMLSSPHICGHLKRWSWAADEDWLFDRCVSRDAHEMKKDAYRHVGSLYWLALFSLGISMPHLYHAYLQHVPNALHTISDDTAHIYVIWSRKMLRVAKEIYWWWQEDFRVWQVAWICMRIEKWIIFCYLLSNLWLSSSDDKNWGAWLDYWFYRGLPRFMMPANNGRSRIKSDWW